MIKSPDWLAVTTSFQTMLDLWFPHSLVGLNSHDLLFNGIWQKLTVFVSFIFYYYHDLYLFKKYQKKKSHQQPKKVL